MDFLSVKETSKKWGLSERSVRNYCATGRIAGAKIIGKTWLIPIDAVKPSRKTEFSDLSSTKLVLLNTLKNEKKNNIKGGIYHKIQIDLTYNSNHIEGSKLSHDETRYIYETNSIGINKESINVDDIIETVNHFRCIDLIIDKVNYKLTESLIKELHYILKNGTSDSNIDWFKVGDYKKIPNEVGGKETTKPENVEKEMRKLLDWYNTLDHYDLDCIIEFHYRFEAIHPFQDGNGRVGRLIMFKECLKNGIVPFIIDEELKLFYYRGLKEWKSEKGYLKDTCLAAQDKFKKNLDYFRIKY
ncbi:MAG: Fic family protein [Bacilli bacterium]|nr:Fic family protein [Bacilli bacterium]